MHCLFSWFRSSNYALIEWEDKKNEDLGLAKAQKWQELFSVSNIDTPARWDVAKVNTYAIKVIAELKTTVPISSANQLLIETHLITLSKLRDSLRSSLIKEMLEFRNDVSRKSNAYQILTTCINRLNFIVSDNV